MTATNISDTSTKLSATATGTISAPSNLQATAKVQRSSIPDATYNRAVRRLAAFIQTQANTTAATVGFGWQAVTNAPSTYPQLRGAYATSLANQSPLPVSSLFCEDTVFGDPVVNIAFRFWHDVHHVRLGLSFELPDELELALWHLGELERAGFGTASLEYALLEADAVGQVLLMGLARRFPFNQAVFARTCVERGLAEGLAAELRRIPVDPLPLAA